MATAALVLRAPPVQKAYPGCCEFCPRDQRVPAVRHYTDMLGFEYRLCERHFAPLAAWRRRKEERERRQLLRRRERQLKEPG